MADPVATAARPTCGRFGCGQPSTACLLCLPPLEYSLGCPRECPNAIHYVGTPEDMP